MDYDSKYDVKRILEDRDKGLSYRDMNKKYNISINTLRKIVNSKQEEKKEESVVDVIYSLSVSKEGLLESDEMSVLSNILPSWNKGVRKKIRRQCRERAKKEGKECLFVPDWMGRQAARANRDKMMQLAHELNLRIEESIYDFMQETGYSDYKNIHYVLCQLAVNGYSPASITEVCDRLDNIVCMLERNSG